ncbi:hypothetical protein HYV87_00600 [Candidatus Woesearchaeota archaeon]|nr:hypothetical protein [Candidatus Woesearchaeota archaeon]
MNPKLAENLSGTYHKPVPLGGIIYCEGLINLHYSAMPMKKPGRDRFNYAPHLSFDPRQSEIQVSTPHLFIDQGCLFPESSTWANMLQFNSWMRPNFASGGTYPAVSMCLVGEVSDRLEASYKPANPEKSLESSFLQFEVKGENDQVKSWLRVNFLMPDLENAKPFYYFAPVR